MIKFYFLDKGGVWRGPLNYFTLVLFTLAGRVSPTTYLWHSRLGKDGAKHPIGSIYARKAAHEFRFLPSWVFASNLKAMAINAIRGVRKRFAPREWEKFVATPIDIKSAIKDAIPAFVMPSITAINDFSSNRDYHVDLVFNTGNQERPTTVPIEIFTDERNGIYFEISLQDPPDNLHGVMYQGSYGLDNNLLLKGRGCDLEVAKNSVFDFSTRYPFKPQRLKGRFMQLNIAIGNDYHHSYNRLIIKVDDDKMVGPQDILASSGRHLYDHEHFNVGLSLMGVSFRQGGVFTDLTIAGLNYRIFSLNDTTLIIDGIDREDLSAFRVKAEIVRVALGILSGKFYGGALLYICSDESTFKTVSGVWYQIERASVISNRRIVDRQAYRSILKDDDGDLSPEEIEQRKIDRPVDAKFFSNLCETLFSNPDVLHAANLVISGMGNSDLLQQGALYSVALEALTNTLGEKKSKDLKPISNAAVSGEFVKDLQAVLAKYQSTVSAGAYIILEKNITGINKPTNRDKLVKTFNLFGIPLSSQDTETIDKRNDYLHGRNPLAQKENFELTQLSLRLHTLIVSLLLKSCGYSGHIINLDSYAYLKDENRQIEFWSRLHTHLSKLLNKLQQALDDGDLGKANDLQVEIKTYLQKLRFEEIFRII